MTTTPPPTQPPAALPEARPIMRWNPFPNLGMNPSQNGLYVRYEDHVAALSAAAPAAPQVVTEADIEAAREFLADVHNATQMRSALDQLRREVVTELAARGIVPDYYGAPQAEPPGATRWFNPADGSPETALQMAAIIAHRDAAAPMSAQPSDRADEILAKICDLFHIGKLARDETTILTNVENVIRFTNFLRALERELFPQPELPEDDDPYAEVEKLPAPDSWGAKDEAAYVEQFRAALAARAAAPAPTTEQAGAPAHRPSPEWYARMAAETDGLDDSLPCGALAAPGGEAPAAAPAAAPDARDAARYRWLREQGTMVDTSRHPHSWRCVALLADMGGEHADAAIDAAMAAQSQKGAA